jgi:Na+-translocating ferredoxin:NAD+ oxidoreductase RnfG subunit
VHTPWTSGLRLDAIYSWGHINRNDNLPDDSAQLFALNAAADLYWTTMELDAISAATISSRAVTASLRSTLEQFLKGELK